MNYVQVIFEIIDEERGYTVKDFANMGYAVNTIKNWQRGHTSPNIREFQLFLECMDYDMVEMLNKVKEHENRNS